MPNRLNCATTFEEHHDAALDDDVSENFHFDDDIVVWGHNRQNWTREVHNQWLALKWGQVLLGGYGHKHPG
jgi:hypothetical protein